MPQYGHRCKCGATLMDLRPMSRVHELPDCSDCGEPMPRDLAVEHEYDLVGVRNANFHTPIEMFSIAPNTPEEHAALASAGAEFTPQGVPLARNRAEKLRLMRTAGVIETN